MRRITTRNVWCESPRQESSHHTGPAQCGALCLWRSYAQHHSSASSQNRLHLRAPFCSVHNMNRLRELRTKAKLTALELGSAIGAAESTVTAWERGTRQISPIQARAIIAALEARNVYVTLDTLYSAPAQAA